MVNTDFIGIARTPYCTGMVEEEGQKTLWPIERDTAVGLKGDGHGDVHEIYMKST
jgi:hypothetical protein